MRNGRVLSIIFAFVGLFLQISALPIFGFTQFVPNLFIAALIPAALLFGSMFGMSVGFIGGLIIDLLTGYGLGLTAIPYAFAGFMAGLLSEYINNHHYASSVMLCIATLIFSDLFTLIVFYFARMEIAIRFTQVYQSFFVILLTSLVSAGIHTFFNRYNQGKERKERVKSRYID